MNSYGWIRIVAIDQEGAISAQCSNGPTPPAGYFDGIGAALAGVVPIVAAPRHGLLRAEVQRVAAHRGL